MKNLQIIVLSIFFLFNLWAAEEIPFEERILILDYPSMVELQLPKGLVLKRDKNVWSGEFDNTSFLFFIEASNGIAAPSFEQLIPKEFKIKEHDLDFYNIKPVQNNQWKGFQAQARQNKQGEFGLVLAVENEGLKIFILVSSRTAPPKTVFDRIFNSLFFFHVSNKINFYARGNEWELTLPYPMPYRFPYFYIKETVFVKLLPAMNEELFFVFHPEGSSEAAKWRYTDGQKYYQKHSPLESIGIRDEKLGLWTASIYKSMEKIPVLFIFGQYDKYVAFLDFAPKNLTQYDIQMCKSIMESLKLRNQMKEKTALDRMNDKYGTGITSGGVNRPELPCMNDKYDTRIISSEQDGVKFSLCLPKNMIFKKDGYHTFMGTDPKDEVGIVLSLGYGKSSIPSGGYQLGYTKFFLKDYHHKILYRDKFHYNNWYGEKILSINKDNVDITMLFIYNKSYFLFLSAISNDRKMNKKILDNILRSIKIISPEIVNAGGNNIIKFYTSNGIWKTSIPSDADFIIHKNNLIVDLPNGNSITVTLKKELTEMLALQRYHSITQKRPEYLSPTGAFYSPRAGWEKELTEMFALQGHHSITQKRSKHLSPMGFFYSPRTAWKISSYEGKNHREEYELFSVACHDKYVISLSYSSKAYISPNEKELCSSILLTLLSSEPIAPLSEGRITSGKLRTF